MDVFTCSSVSIVIFHRDVNVLFIFFFSEKYMLCLKCHVQHFRYNMNAWIHTSWFLIWSQTHQLFAYSYIYSIWLVVNVCILQPISKCIACVFNIISIEHEYSHCECVVKIIIIISSRKLNTFSWNWIYCE